MVALIVVLSLAVVVLAYALTRSLASHKSAYAYSLDRAQEAQFYREKLASVVDVLEKCAGGVTKRISEHAEIKAAISSHAPMLPVSAPGIKYWLDANGQFFEAIVEVTGIKSERERVLEESKRRHLADADGNNAAI